MSIKSELAPKGIDFSKSSSFIMSDKYCTILSVISYPKLIGEGYLSSSLKNPETNALDAGTRTVNIKIENGKEVCTFSS